MAIVDDEGERGCGAQTGTQGFGELAAGRRNLGNGSFRRRSGPGSEEAVVDRVGCEAEPEIAVLIDPDHAFVPSAVAALELPDGDGIEELIGNEDHRAG